MLKKGQYVKFERNEKSTLHVGDEFQVHKNGGGLLAKGQILSIEKQTGGKATFEIVVTMGEKP